MDALQQHFPGQEQNPVFRFRMIHMTYIEKDHIKMKMIKMPSTGYVRG